jgi:hypothetical protein
LISQQDAPEEFARRMMIRALKYAAWTFGVDPDSIFVTRMRRALGMVQGQPLGVPETPRQIFCAWCGREAVAKSANQKFCSDDCAKERQRVEQLQRQVLLRREPRTFCCARPGCGKMATATNASQKFCTTECRLTHEQSKRKFRETFRCLECGEEYYRKNPDQRFCPPSVSDCRYRYNKRLREQRLLASESPGPAGG